MQVDASDAVRRFARIQEEHKRKLTNLAGIAGNKMARYAQRNYPWARNRTHAARDTISAEAEWPNRNQLRLSLRSGVNYGIYLEFVKFKHKGRLSIWWPTILRHKEEILAAWAKATRSSP